MGNCSRPRHKECDRAPTASDGSLLALLHEDIIIDGTGWAAISIEVSSARSAENVGPAQVAWLGSTWCLGPATLAAVALEEHLSVDDPVAEAVRAWQLERVQSLRMYVA